jgi:hypothetical protein
MEPGFAAGRGRASTPDVNLSIALKSLPHPADTSLMMTATEGGHRLTSPSPPSLRHTASL